MKKLLSILCMLSADQSYAVGCCGESNLKVARNQEQNEAKQNEDRIALSRRSTALAPQLHNRQQSMSLSTNYNPDQAVPLAELKIKEIVSPDKFLKDITIYDLVLFINGINPFNSRQYELNWGTGGSMSYDYQSACKEVLKKLYHRIKEGYFDKRVEHGQFVNFCSLYLCTSDELRNFYNQVTNFMSNANVLAEVKDEDKMYQASDNDALTEHIIQHCKQENKDILKKILNTEVKDMNKLFLNESNAAEAELDENSAVDLEEKALLDCNNDMYLSGLMRFQFAEHLVDLVNQYYNYSTNDKKPEYKQVQDYAKSYVKSYQDKRNNHGNGQVRHKDFLAIIDILSNSDDLPSYSIDSYWRRLKIAEMIDYTYQNDSKLKKFTLSARIIIGENMERFHHQYSA